MTNRIEDRREYFRKESTVYAFKQYAKCIVLYARASHKRHDITSSYGSATIDYRNGNFHKAIKKYRLTATVKPNSQRTYNAWGSCLSHLGRFDEAIWKFKKALEIDQYYGLAYLNWGLVLFWQQNKDEAEEIIREGLEKTDFRGDVIVSLYKMEESSVEGRLEKASNEEEKEFLKERIVGYHWMLELIHKIFDEKALLEDGENQ